MTRRGRALTALMLTAALALAGSAASTATALSPKKSEQAAQFTAHTRQGDPVRVEVLSLNVVDDLAELRVLITVSATEPATATPGPIPTSDLWAYSKYHALLSDSARHTAYTIVMESEDDTLVPGEPYLYQAFFPAPAKEATELDVTVDPSWPRVLNVPVVRGAPEQDQRADLSVSDVKPDAKDVEDATKVFALDKPAPSGGVWDLTKWATVESLAAADKDVVTLSSDILFASDKAELSQAAKDAIAKLVADAPKGAAVKVDGHTDTVDTDAHNDALSKRRAQAVADAIAAVRPDLKLTVTGHGKRKLKVAESGDDIAEDRARNRRVELTVGGTATKAAPTPTPTANTSSSPRTGTSPTVLPDPKDADLLPGAKIEVPVADHPGSTLRFEVEQVTVRGVLTQADVIATLVNPPAKSAAPTGVTMYDILGSFRPALVDRTNLLRYPEPKIHYVQEWKSQGETFTHLEDGEPHRFRWTFAALTAKTDTVDLVIDSQIPELTGLPVTYDK